MKTKSITLSNYKTSHYKLWLHFTQNQMYLLLTRWSSPFNLISKCILIPIKYINYKIKCWVATKFNKTLILLLITVFRPFQWLFLNNNNPSIGDNLMILEPSKKLATPFKITDWSMKTSRDLNNNNLSYLIICLIPQWVVSNNSLFIMMLKTMFTTISIIRNLSPKWLSLTPTL